MGQRGPAPKPTKIKRLEGNPGKRPLNEREPQPAENAPPCPAILSSEAKKEWRRVCKELMAVGLLTTVDRALLAAYCEAWADFVEAQKIVSAKGFQRVLKSDKGNSYINPWVGVANQARKQLKAFADVFGMSPSSRSRLVMAGDEEEDEYDQYRKRSGENPFADAADDEFDEIEEAGITPDEDSTDDE